MTWLRTIQFFLFAWFGIATEVFFTAFYQVGSAIAADQPVNWQLKGWSYPYMLPIYGSIALFFPIVYRYIGSWKAPLRWLTLVLGIYVVEFTTGLLLEAILGRCPWHYEVGWQVMHVIRLDFAPGWLAFSIIVDWLFTRSEAILRKGLDISPKA